MLNQTPPGRGGLFKFYMCQVLGFQNDQLNTDLTNLDQLQPAFCLEWPLAGLVYL